jgi:hypothetical protein
MRLMAQWKLTYAEVDAELKPVRGHPQARFPAFLCVEARATTGDHPVVQFNLEVLDQEIALTCFSLDAVAGQRPILPAMLREVDAFRLVDRACREWLREETSQATSKQPARYRAPASDAVLRAVLSRGVRRRSNAPSLDELQAVADAHRAGGVQEVIDRLGFQRQTAYRRVKLARDEGLLAREA